MDTKFYEYRDRPCLLLGSTGSIGRYLKDFCVSNGMVVTTLDPAGEEDINAGLFQSGDEESINRVFNHAIAILGEVDFILCAYDFEGARSKLEEDEMNPETWEKLLRDWVLNQFLLLRASAGRFNDGKKRRIVYFNSTRGYTGEGEGEGDLGSGGTLHEAACSGGITGMMTSIARSIIPKGWSVNGIAFDRISEVSVPKLTWGLNLWLSGMGEYSCGEVYRVYES